MNFRPKRYERHALSIVASKPMTRLLYALCLVVVTASLARADDLVRDMTSIQIALPGGGQARLEAMIVRPDRPGRFPLVIMVHGTPRDLRTIRNLSPALYIVQAEYFAARGYAAVAIMRRGFGHSDGPYAETIRGPCEARDYLAVSRISAQDVLGAVTALRSEPWVDPGRVVLLGHSTGGVAVTAAAATNPAGVVGILDFAGGRGSNAPDHVCSPDRLTEAFGVFGKTARIPALWIYAENDHFFSPALARQMFEAYTAAGAPARLVMLPPVGDDGHSALTAAPKLIWPPVETFLASLGLPTTTVVSLPPLPALPAPPGLNDSCAAGFRDYVTVRNEAKAFAINPEGHCGWIFSAVSVDEAKRIAMESCAKRAANCVLYAVGQSLATR